MGYDKGSISSFELRIWDLILHDWEACLVYGTAKEKKIENWCALVSKLKFNLFGRWHSLQF